VAQGKEYGGMSRDQLKRLKELEAAVTCGKPIAADI
jgi:hypothetical protein